MKAISGLLTTLAIMFCLASGTKAATYFTGNLNSAQEVPTNSSTAAGFGRVTLNDAETQITVSLTFSGLSSNQVASHIHAPAPPGVNAPVLFNIGSTGATSGTFTALTFAVTPAQVADLKAGLFYFNVHSTNFSGGEIRGQIALDSPFVSTFSSKQEVPTNTSTAMGFGNVSLNKAETQIIASLQFSGLTSNQVASHIHGAASPGVNAPVLFNIGSQGMTSGSFVDLFFNVTSAQALQLKTGQFYFNVHSVNFPGGEIRGQILRRRSTVLDFDGDSKTDYAVARNNTTSGSVEWYILNSGGGAVSFLFGAAGTTNDFNAARLMAGDFDGDGKDDPTVWRAGTQGAFYILLSSNSTIRTELFGQTGDDPRMIYDYDGDGRTDPAVWRSGSQGFLYYRASAGNPDANISSFAWGTSGDFPSPGDYDGDGKGDICNQRGGTVFCFNSTTGYRALQYGLGSDFFAPGDYDGDGKTDLMVVRILSGTSTRLWIPLRSSDNQIEYIQWGSSSGTTRAQGDYDGDGITDIAVWQSGAQSIYYVRASSLLSTSNPLLATYWGTTGDIPVNGYNVR